MDEIDRLADKLANWPSNGKHEIDDDVIVLKAYGFIEEKTHTQLCRSCGTPQFAHSHMRVTQAGRLFLAAAQRGKK
jgi:hypothetical protein